MPKLFGQDLTRRQILQRVGDITQLADAREMELTSGKGRGVRAIEVKNGSGLNFTVLPDRGMDIAWTDYKGIPVSCMSKVGVTSPYLFDEDDFLRYFYCGLLTTCGLTYMGTAGIDNGRKLGLHGKAANTPACDVSVMREWDGEDYCIRLRGKTEESRVFSEKIVLTREISVKMGENVIHINDVVENLGFERQPIMMLYHVNFGFPLLDAGAYFETDCTVHKGRDDEATRGLQTYGELSAPVENYREQVFYHEKGTYGRIVNKKLGLAATVEYSPEQLPILVQWKMVGEGDYILGIEAGTWYVDGRPLARKLGQLDYIEPLEKRHFNLSIRIEEI